MFEKGALCCPPHHWHYHSATKCGQLPEKGQCLKFPACSVWLTATRSVIAPGVDEGDLLAVFMPAVHRHFTDLF